MAQVMAGGVCREIDVVVLDKDGTLTDFHTAWSARYTRSIGAMVKAVRGDNVLKAALYHTLAINTANGRFLQDSPIVSVKIGDKAVMVATVLHQSGIEWSKAQAIVAEHMLPVLTAPSEPHQIRGIGNILERVRIWKSAGLHVAISTNDNRVGTLAELRLLGIDDEVDVIVSADDVGLASKPAPDGLLHIARTLGFAANRLAMVGDTATDMLAGRSARVGFLMGVLSGLATADHLAPLADVVVPDIHALSVVDA
jgi:HAD superfamily hydrolase (TIGR01549 family)